MRLIVFLLLLFPWLGFTQKYLFNGKTDSVFYKAITNTFLVKEGVPMSMDRILNISITEDPKLFTVVFSENQDVQESVVYIISYLENPETKEQEKVVIDKIPVRLRVDYPKDTICILNLKERENPDKIELKICGEHERGLKIISYEISFKNEVYSVKSGSLTNELRNKLLQLKTGEEITINVLYKDLLNKTDNVKQTIIK